MRAHKFAIATFVCFSFLFFISISSSSIVEPKLIKKLQSSSLVVEIYDNQWIFMPVDDDSINVTLTWDYIIEKSVPPRTDPITLFSSEPIKTWSNPGIMQNYTVDIGTKLSVLNKTIEYVNVTYHFEGASFSLPVEMYEENDLVSFEDKVKGLVFPVNSQSLKFGVELRNWKHSGTQENWIAFGILMQASEPINITDINANKLPSAICLNTTHPDYKDGPINAVSFNIPGRNGSSGVFKSFDFSENDGVFGCELTRNSITDPRTIQKYWESDRKILLVDFYFKAENEVIYDPELSILFGSSTAPKTAEPNAPAPITIGTPGGTTPTEGVSSISPEDTSTIPVAIAISAVVLVVLVAVILVFTVKPLRQKLGLISWDYKSKKVTPKLSNDNSHIETTSGGVTSSDPTNNNQPQRWQSKEPSQRFTSELHNI